MLKHLTLLIFALAFFTSCAKKEEHNMNRLKDSESPYLLQHKNNPVGISILGSRNTDEIILENLELF